MGVHLNDCQCETCMLRDKPSLAQQQGPCHRMVLACLQSEIMTNGASPTLNKALMCALVRRYRQMPCQHILFPFELDS
jgi:hypothetical protein